MFQRGHIQDFARLGLNEQTRWILFADLPIPQIETAVAQEVAGFRFITSTIVWLDIVASITAGTAPMLVSHHSRILTAGSQTQLRDIMGCDNWVLLQIARIARLYENMNRTTQEGQDDLTGFGESASEIRLGLQYSTSQIARATSPRVTTEDPHALITRVFANMAVVYLHLVMHGFQKLDLMDDVLCSSMRIIRTRSGRHLQALVPPLFILGVIAKQEDQQFLRDILSIPPLLDPFLRHRLRLLPILEDIWKRRDTPGFAWHHCVELTKDILLV
ncbi:hypothetical protein N0V83_005138 [Neocucurbitaria cava]|uniref:Uncharacterized protein n=1 Tax=Neocucurbitaria cava TaxID=798079 RepID=A0A9W9CLX3_9PLEO|nr:hypothetical protein N0V83_005138 [Neocucurbitaria cava]